MENRKVRLRPGSDEYRLAPIHLGTTRLEGHEGSAPFADAFVDTLTRSGRLLVVANAEIQRAPQLTEKRTASSIELDVPASPDERLVLVARHSSGALSLHPSLTNAEARGRAARRARRTRFLVPVETGTPERRGPLAALTRVVVLKVLGTMTDAVLPRLAATWERKLWQAKGIPRGLLRVTGTSWSDGFRRIAGPDDFAPPPSRNLLLIHGAFSHSAAAFGPLAITSGSAGNPFSDVARTLYGDRIFAFNHFTLSESPEDNARALLNALPRRPLCFDAIAHSRGGLVLRHLVESTDTSADHFRLGHAVLVAVPNQGTPLASAPRWQEMLGWIANLVDAFPTYPFGLALELVTEGLVWLAQRASGSLAGLAAMAPDSPALAALGAGPPRGDYSALVAHYQPETHLLDRLLDAGCDRWFDGANDLIVPTEAGWQVDPQGVAIPGERIGCFGPGGNLAAGPVHHLNLLTEPSSVDFLVRAIQGISHPLRPMDPRRRLSEQLTQRVASPPSAATDDAAGTVQAPASIAPPIAGGTTLAPVSWSAISADNVLSLFVVSSRDHPDHAELLATFRNARVLERFERKGDRWRTIIGIQRAIRGYLDGSPKIRALPGEAKLREFGQALFETLFPGQVRRLYDVARSLRGSRRLDIILTSMIDWVADNPWEFVFDPDRKVFLATEEINFVRNVLTAIPAEEAEGCGDRLRILVVAAQPLGAAPLSGEEETTLIRRGFAELTQAGLAELTVVPSATPDLLHRHLQASRFDVLHFIGHGEYDQEQQKGYLLFEDSSGGGQRIDSESVRQIITHRGIRLVFLNACETGTGGRADFNRGVAPALVASGVPAVVANQYPVLDLSAITFAQHFYWALAQGRSLGDAAREARIGVNYSVAGASIDWAVPVVYARNPLEALCRPLPETRIEAVSSLALARHRGARSHDAAAERVALWDVNQAVASLEPLVASLNRVQSQFGIQVVNATAPLGTWRLERDETGEDAFLHGGRLRDRLQHKPRELGVNRLMCITTFRLGDDDFNDLYLWDEDVPGEDRGVISFFSLHGWSRQLKPPELTVERAIVNALVSCLSETSEHRGGPESCPLFFNPKRRIKSIAGPLAFDQRCRKRVRRKTSPGRLAALEAMLKAST